MQKLYRDSRWVKRERKARRVIDFKLDAEQPARSSICRRLRAETSLSMAMLTAAVGKRNAREISRAARYRVEIIRDWKRGLFAMEGYERSDPVSASAVVGRVVCRVRGRSNTSSH